MAVVEVGRAPRELEHSKTFAFGLTRQVVWWVRAPIVARRDHAEGLLDANLLFVLCNEIQGLKVQEDVWRGLAADEAGLSEALAGEAQLGCDLRGGQTGVGFW